MTQFTDQTLNCQDCPDQFVFSARDQAFFAQQGYSTPKRCKTCREKHKAKKEQSQTQGFRAQGTDVHMQSARRATQASTAPVVQYRRHTGVAENFAQNFGAAAKPAATRPAPARNTNGGGDRRNNAFEERRARKRGHRWQDQDSDG